MSTINKTENLKLPQYQNTDTFDLKEINEAYSEIDRSYTEINDNYNKAIDESTIKGAIDNLELIDARKGTAKLRDKIDQIDASLEHITNEVDKFRVKRGYIVHIGDSTSAGTTSFQRDTCTWLGFKLGKKVINKGIWGNYLYQVLERLDTDVIPYKPKYCSILCGTNDINGGRSADLIRTDIEAITVKLLENNITPIWLTITPRTDNASLKFTIINHNYWLQSYCNVNNLLFCDIYSALCVGETSNLTVKSNVLLSDNLHLTADGHRIVADKLYNIITTKYSDKLPSICNGDISLIIPNHKLHNYSNYPTVKVADGWSKQSGSFASATYDFEEMTYPNDANARRKQVITMPQQATSQVAGLYVQLGASLSQGKTYDISFDLDFTANEQCNVSVYIDPCNNSGVSLGQTTKCLYGAEIQTISQRISFQYTIPSGAVKHDFIISFSGKQFIAKVNSFNCHEIVGVVD